LQPDLSALGVNIIASWLSIATISDYPVEFNIILGTSLSCLHVSSAAAYIKLFHPAL